ncbi:MAG: hypothetical protein RIF32_00020, partial [Leptospirales bacterium]
LTTKRYGKLAYIAGNVTVLFVLTLLFQSQWLQIEWIGAIVVGIYFACLIFIVSTKGRNVLAIDSAPEGRTLDFHKIDSVH